MNMEYPESIRSRMFDWYEEPPPLDNRVEPKVRDVTPCSEYTRYTVEGILKDPRSELSAVLDVEAMGPIFMNSDLRDPKWSSRLGYGMAVVGEDTRIHIHRNGKYIIRRALDRQHAEATYGKIVNMIRPVLYDTESGRYLWDMIRGVLDGNMDPGMIAPFIMWPENEEGDHRSRFEKVRKGASEVDKILLEPLRKMIMDGRIGELGAMNEKINEMTGSFLEGSVQDNDILLGRISALIWARYAITSLEGSEKIDPKGVNDWNGMVVDHSLSSSDRKSILIARLHYLLSPVD
jgi:hypothetical protein